MTETEGVIKYQLEHKNSALEKQHEILEINAWRDIFLKLQLMGQHPQRYQGFGFGNISQRISNSNEFIISGTQTGVINHLSKSDYCHVIKANPEKNHIQSSGETKPSSEALTHASVYQFNKNIQAIIHVHSPDIWSQTQELKLPYTAKDIPYGTPEMAAKVNQLLTIHNMSNSGVFSMLGHEDGIIAFADSIKNAAIILINVYAKALALPTV